MGSGPEHRRPINKASVGLFSLKISTLAISVSAVTLKFFFMPSDYCVVGFLGTLVFEEVPYGP
jgi:hypothetical protein